MSFHTFLKNQQILAIYTHHVVAKRLPSCYHICHVQLFNKRICMSMQNYKSKRGQTSQ